ncbi:MAG: hypothetical protein FJZ87_11520 [Chloroflexi bacterium]|nr:hypothetical protein [Chloroflexota bacterium]
MFTASIDEILNSQKIWLTAEDARLEHLANESLKKCAEAVSVLIRNLKEVGYDWAAVEPIPRASLERSIETVEKSIGSPVPPILVEFWEKVGGVSLVDLKDYRHTEFWMEHKLVPPAGFCDGLHVDACSDEWAHFICDDFVDWKDYQSDGSDEFLLSLSPDGFHKDDISGGAPYGVHGGSSWRPVWENFSWSGSKHPASAPDGPPDFLSYLRTTMLECAGFPALLGMPAFDPMRERLLKGVPVF